MFCKRRSASRQSLMKQQCVLVNKSEGNELSEASGFPLNVAQQQHLANPVLRRFRMPVHHGRGRAYAAAMSRADDFDPLRGGELVGRKDGANFVVKDFSGGAG